MDGIDFNHQRVAALSIPLVQPLLSNAGFWSCRRARRLLALRYRVFGNFLVLLDRVR